MILENYQEGIGRPGFPLCFIYIYICIYIYVYIYILEGGAENSKFQVQK
jgi:hypothetical protein